MTESHILHLDVPDDGPSAADRDSAHVELERIGLMACYADRPAGMKREGPSLASELFPTDHNGGFGVQELPADLFDADVRRLAYRIVRAVYWMEPPRNPLMSAVYRMLALLADQGIETNMDTITLGLLLGAARVHGVKIQTHPRDLAKLAGCRYAVLLKVRKAAASVLRTR